jgi:glycerophosphoryl diester phosphodiesterase
MRRHGLVRLLLVPVLAVVLLAPFVPQARHIAAQVPYVKLTGFAVLPADTFAPGPPSGFEIAGEYFGRTPPFESQPVQGVSAVLPKWNGNYLVMSDNGFGSKANSPDYRLRWYEVSPDFDSGSVEIIGYTELSDPDNHIPWPIVNETGDRVLTGADFDLESFRQAPDDTFWFGEEFGPYLLHTNVFGELLGPPIPTPYPAVLEPYARGLPYVQAPENPAFFDLPSREERVAAANHPASRGFEGMALNASGTHLYPLLEGPMADAPDARLLLLQEFSLEDEQYTGEYWFYPTVNPGNPIGDLTAINDNEFLVIERDNNQGEEAEIKHVYRIDLREVDENRVLQKDLIVDLLNIADPDGITSPEEGAIGFGPVFSFPFVTIESIYPIDGRTLLIINDNNYPFSSGRRPELAPDNTEFIKLRLPAENDLSP